MERKIGEIFEHNGEWYQCVEQPKNCIGEVCEICDFHSIGNCEIDECSGRYRIDKQNVIFNKLEKVGGTYAHNSVIVQKYRIRATPVIMQNEPYMYFNAIDNTIAIELKQTKEDMEEKNNAKHSNSENIGKNLKEFNLEAAKSGKPVCTRDGRKARIICFDRRLFYRKVSYPILALVERSDGEDDVCEYNEKGKVLIEDGAEYKDDLMMLPEKKEGWVNVYDADTTFRFVEGMVYNTKDEAIQRAKEEVTNGQREKNEYVDTVKICWEE